MNADLSKRQRNLRRLLRPRHVAIVGGQAMADSIRRCADTGFTGEVWVINPKYSELGAQFAMSHTGSLAGSDKMYDALFGRLGIIRVHSVPQLLETLKLVST